MIVLPGTYEVRLIVDGRTQTQPLTVAMDPRVHTPAADLTAQRDFYDAVTQAMEEATEAHEKSEGKAKEGIATAAAVLSALATDLEACDCAPTASQREVFETYRKQLDALFKESHP
jgi:hypothetical protein